MSFNSLRKIRNFNLTKTLKCISNQQLFSTAAASAVVNSSNITSTTEPVVKCRELAILPRDSAIIGKKVNKLRKEGLMPGVVYGVEEVGKLPVKVLVQVNFGDFVKELRYQGAAIENTLYKYQYKDKTVYVIPRQVQYHPYKEFPIASNFIIYRPGLPIRIPIRYTNEDDNPDIKKGAFLVIVNQFIEVICNDYHVPECIIIDMLHMKVGDVIRLKTLRLPRNVKPSKNVSKDFVASVLQNDKS